MPMSIHNPSNTRSCAEGSFSHMEGDEIANNGYNLFGMYCTAIAMERARLQTQGIGEKQNG